VPEDAAQKTQDRAGLLLIGGMEGEVITKDGCDDRIILSGKASFLPALNETCYFLSRDLDPGRAYPYSSGLLSSEGFDR